MTSQDGISSPDSNCTEAVDFDQSKRRPPWWQCFEAVNSLYSVPGKYRHALLVIGGHAGPPEYQCTLTPESLGNELGIEAGTARRTITELERRGLVEVCQPFRNKPWDWVIVNWGLIFASSKNPNGKISEQKNFPSVADFSPNDTSYKNSKRTPPPPEEKLEEEVSGDSFSERLIRLEVDRTEECLSQAREKGFSESLIGELIAYFETNASAHGWGGGALFNRLTAYDPQLPLDRGWPKRKPVKSAAVTPTQAANQTDLINWEAAYGPLLDRIPTADRPDYAASALVAEIQNSAARNQLCAALKKIGSAEFIHHLQIRPLLLEVLHRRSLKASCTGEGGET